MREEPGKLEEGHLKDYLWVAYKRRWTVSAVFCAVVLLVLVYSLTRVPVYKATTRILIEKENQNITDFKELYAIDTTNQDFYQTQYEIIKSRYIAEHVIDTLKPTEGDDVGGAGILGRLMFWRAETASAEDKKEGLVAGFMKNLKIEPVRNTRLADVHFFSPDPSLAARMADAAVQAYIGQTLETKFHAVQGATQYLSDKIDEQRKKLEESELLLQQYKEQFNIISLKEKENITVSKLAELNSDVIRVENERVEAETRYRQAKAIEDKPEQIESIPNVLSSNIITTLKQEEANLSKELSELLKKFGERHPRIITIREKLKTTRESLGAEIAKVVKYLRNEYEVALAKETMLKKALEEQKQESQRLNKLSIAYGVLAREVETNKQIYDVLLTRIKEAGIAGGIQSTNVRVVDAALVPKTPVRPNKTFNMVVAVIVGLLGGVGIAFFFEYLDNTVKMPEDLSRYVRVPYMGPIPSFKKEMGDEPIERMLVTLSYPKSTSAEAYRGIRTAIMFSSTAEKNRKTLLVTSSGPSEGKSLTSCNLAVAMAQAGTRTLIIDADFRKPRVHKIFGITRDTGFSNFLVGKADLGSIIVKSKVPNLDIIPAGVVPPNPAELIGSEGMRRTIEHLKGMYDRIIIDSPPVTAVTDAVILGTLVDEVVLVVAAGRFSRDFVRRAAEQLKDVGANVIGAVLNNIEAGQENYYYYQYYYYYYGESSADTGSGMRLADMFFKRGHGKKKKERTLPGETSGRS